MANLSQPETSAPPATAPVHKTSTQTELTASQVVQRCEPASLGFELTSELVDEESALGQERALEAIELGIEIKRAGFNIFVVGPAGSGRRALAEHVISRRARTEPVPNDYCYVHNFAQPRRPKALRLQPGQGAQLRDHMERLIADLPQLLSAAFDNQSYRERREAIERDIEQRQEQELTAIGQAALTRDIAVVRTPSGVALLPMRNGKMLEPAEREQLSPAESARFEQNAQIVHDELHQALLHVPQLQREQRDRIRTLDQSVVESVIAELMTAARAAFASSAMVLEHLAGVARDIAKESTELLRNIARKDSATALPFVGWDAGDGPLRRYRVNLFVDHTGASGAPVVVLDNPTSTNLVGKVEHLSQFGVLLTDFNLIKAGALHRANGGYLIIDARRLLQQPTAWEQLKRALSAAEIRIESVAEALDLSQGISQEPEPIPWSGKVILIGEPWLHARLRALDPEFSELFKVQADFEVDVDRTLTSSRAYAHLLGKLARRAQLLPLSAAAAARLIDESSRFAEDSTRLSMQVRSSIDLLCEADHLAKRDKKTQIGVSEVQRALDARTRRQGRVRERLHKTISDGTLHVELSGCKIGQINGLAVVQSGGLNFGFPMRITARARCGTGDVIDIEREVQLGGPQHTKGVLILSAFLGGRYQVDKPLSLHASLVFEQSYGVVDGDSASLAELLALLSAIAELPIRQDVAVTGSIDQHGLVQAVGGLNEKIEGFFDVCRARDQQQSSGVIIPRANIRHLMLRDDVVQAIELGKFHVWAVENVDEAIEVVFDQPAGMRSTDGHSEGSVNARVDSRLAAFYEASKRGDHRAAK